MSKPKPCNKCALDECDFQYVGKHYVCSHGYVLTVEDIQRLLRESNEEAKRNGEIKHEK